jgi:hypothetical protein
MPHLSDSAVQRAAEASIVEGLASAIGVVLQAAGPIQVGGGARVEVDARSADGQILVEASARQGSLKGAQLKKVGQDLLKFALLRQLPEFADARLILAFASEDACGSVRGWLARTAHEFRIELTVVALPHRLKVEILEAQGRQVMVNQADDFLT